MKMLINVIFLMNCILNCVFTETSNNFLMITSLAKLEETKINAMKGDSLEAFKLFEHYELGLNDSQNGNLWIEICAENGDPYGMLIFAQSLEMSNKIERCKFFFFNAIQNSAFSTEKNAFYEKYPNFIIPNTSDIDKLNIDTLKKIALQGNIKAAEKLSELDSYWIKIAAQNGSKKCMEEYSKLLEKKGDELSIIRSKYWLNKSKE